MEVIVARKAGFCMGVKRAVSMVLDLKKQRKSLDGIYGLGPVIHNPQFISYLEKYGMQIVDSLDQISRIPATVVIRAHGVPRQVLDSAKNRGFEIIDGTCPYVSNVHKMAVELEKKGYFVVVVGESGHPEVMGIVSNIGSYSVFEMPSDAIMADLSLYKKIGILAQTTQTKKNFDSIVSLLKETYADTDFIICNTICNATAERQEAAKDLAKQVDVMLVVGGHNSGNTRRLYDVCSEIVQSHHIETASEIKKEWFNAKESGQQDETQDRGVRIQSAVMEKNQSIKNEIRNTGVRIGLTAGASTPDWIIKEVEDYCWGL